MRMKKYKIIDLKNKKIITFLFVNTQNISRNLLTKKIGKYFLIKIQKIFVLNPQKLTPIFLQFFFLFF